MLKIDDAAREWSHQTLSVSLTAGAHVIAFSGGDADSTSDQYGALIDNVSLRQITEASLNDTLVGSLVIAFAILVAFFLD